LVVCDLTRGPRPCLPLSLRHSSDTPKQFQATHAAESGAAISRWNPTFAIRSTRDGFLGRSRSGPFAVQAGSLTDSFSREPSVAGAFVGHLPVWQKTAPNCRHPEAILGGGNGPSRCGRLLAQRAILLGAAVPPGLLVLLAGVVAGPEQ